MKLRALLWVLIELVSVSSIALGVAAFSRPAALIVCGVAGLVAGWRSSVDGDAE